MAGKRDCIKERLISGFFFRDIKLKTTYASFCNGLCNPAGLRIEVGIYVSIEPPSSPVASNRADVQKVAFPSSAFADRSWLDNFYSHHQIECEECSVAHTF